MAAVQRSQPTSTSTTTGSGSKLDMNLTIRLRPKAVIISAADFSYGHDDVECMGERYLTPYNVNGDDKPFFEDFVTAKGNSKPRRDGILIQEIPVSPSPPSSLVSSPRSEQPPLRAVVRWKDVPDHKGNMEKPKDARPEKSASTGRSVQADHGQRNASTPATAPKPLKSILKPTSSGSPTRDASQTQPQSRPSASQQQSRRRSGSPGLARIPESPKETSGHSPSRSPGQSSPTYPPQQLHYQPQPPQPYSSQQTWPAYPQYYAQPYPSAYPSHPPLAYPPQYSSQASSQRPVASYTNRYRPTRDSQSHAEYQYRPAGDEKQSGRRASTTAAFPPHHDAEERRSSH